MKYIIFFIFILTFSFLISCKKDVKDEQLTFESPYLTVQKLGLGIVANLDPELIQVIKMQMVEQGRAGDTARLLRTYDLKTGKLLIKVDNAVYDEPFEFENGKVDSSLIKESDTLFMSKADPIPWNHYYLKYKAHLQDEGWTGPDCGPVSYLQYVGTRHQSRRMEAFILSHDESDPMIIPDIRYQANSSGLGWLWEQTWNGEAGTTHQSRMINQLKIRSATSGYTTKYMIHVQDYGDMGWFYNGAVAGPYPYKRVEGMALDIYKW